jgi:predicted GIY-YIG superfamily endonuclease
VSVRVELVETHVLLIEMPFYVYILCCQNHIYSCGHTDNIETRMDQHSQGKIGDTAKRKPVELIWHTQFAAREEASVVEQ